MKRTVSTWNENSLPYPRLCAHRGYSAAAPENSMPAFEAAVAIGAHEIEFDVRMTADGEVASLHDGTLDRVSDGTWDVGDYTLAQLKQLDFGVRYGEQYRGLRILTLEEILEALGKRIIMNIEVKTPNLTDPLPEAYLRRIAGLIREYDCTEYVYLVCGNDRATEQLLQIAPDISVVCSGGGTTERRWQIVERAIHYGCKKLQFHKSCMTREMIEKAHAHGIRCNVFWSDDPEETKAFLEMGIDTILANDCGAVAPVLVAEKKEEQYE